jgi:hypothetical protein
MLPVRQPSEFVVYIQLNHRKNQFNFQGGLYNGIY